MFYVTKYKMHYAIKGLDACASDMIKAVRKCQADEAQSLNVRVKKVSGTHEIYYCVAMETLHMDWTRGLPDATNNTEHESYLRKKYSM